MTPSNHPSLPSQQRTRRGLLVRFSKVALSLGSVLLAGWGLFSVSSRSPTLQRHLAELQKNTRQASTKAIDPSEAEAANITTVASVTVQSNSEVVTKRTYSGVFMATQSSDLGFKRTGQLVELRVDQGQTVNKGDVLAVLDTRTILAEKAVLQAQRRAAQARLDELIAGPRAETISAAMAKLAEYAAMREQARATAERKRRLISSNATSRQSVDDAKYSLEATESRYRSQLEVVRELEAGTRQEQLDSQRAILEQLGAQIDAIDIQLDESQLVAPFDAVVSRRFVDTGVIVAPQVSILRVVEDKLPEAWIGLPIDVAREMTADTETTIIANDQTFAARFKTVLPELDASTRTQTVIFEIIPQGKATPTIGAVAQLEWTHSSDDTGFWIPLQAIARGTRGLWSVFLLEPHPVQEGWYVVRHRDAEVLQVETDRVMVRGFLNAGDRIVAAGVQRLTPGQVVRCEVEKQPELHSVHQEPSTPEDATLNPKLTKNKSTSLGS